MTALIGNLVWACLAGSAIALVIAGAVAALIRIQRPAASMRCGLWFVALTLCVIAPLAIAGTMLAKGTASPIVIPNEVEGQPQTRPTQAQNAPSDVIPSDVDGQPQSRLARVTQPLRQPPALTRKIALAIVAIWALGALAGLLGLARSLRRVHALKLRSDPLEGALADDLPWLTEIAGREIYLRLSYEIETPIAVGFRRPVILIPTAMATADGLTAIESLVMHEYAHLARFDDWTNLAQRVIERIVWFNPLVWIVGRRIALEREVAADDAVVARTNNAKEYAATLWRMAREMRMPEHVVVAPGAMLTRKQISIRIERLLEHSRVRRPQTVTTLAVIVLGACTVAAVAATAPPIVFADTTVAVAAPIAPDPAPVAEPAPPAAPVLALPAAAIALPNMVADIVGKVVTHAVAAADFAGRQNGQSRFVGADFANADLHGQDLHGLRLDGANLEGADLHGANLRGAHLTGTNLQNADLDHADLRDAVLTGANLTDASMNGTLLTNAVLTGAALP